MDTGNLEERYKEMMLIKNGMVIDPANRIEQPADVLVKDGRILRIAKGRFCERGADGEHKARSRQR